MMNILNCAVFFLSMLAIDRSRCEQFKHNVLENHNFFRELHDSPDLVLNDALVKDCYSYAAVLAKNDKIEMSNGSYGENLCSKSDNSIDCTLLWYKDIKYFDWTYKHISHKSNRFTQLVWKSSKELGVGIAQSKKSGIFYVVCRYTPAGNVKDKYQENVLPFKGNGANLKWVISLNLFLLCSTTWILMKL